LEKTESPAGGIPVLMMLLSKFKYKIATSMLEGINKIWEYEDLEPRYVI
jgi:hypothetical protein